MRFWTIFWLLVVAIVATFGVVNWQVLMASTNINLLFAQVTAPLGFIMFGALVTLGLLFLIFLVWLETKVLVDLGRTNRPASSPSSGAPIADLRADLERQLSALRAETTDSMRNVMGRFEHVERVIRDEVGRASHSPDTRVDKIDRAS